MVGSQSNEIWIRTIKKKQKKKKKKKKKKKTRCLTDQPIFLMVFLLPRRMQVCNLDGLLSSKEVLQ